ncbi:kinase-like protein [Saccharata proteae CBS 121410]|uniref:Kinase-like protein n=1 Tax=Saccharata proteae CBS 121410 TaxID=1314787 RepID=A0A9P4HZ53_9PEZI|nr:kinase-like protein [Saccharata proteae CBS 121410]
MCYHLDSRTRTLLSWGPHEYYPARIGEVLDSRYQIVGKLGYGSTSAFWMFGDLHDVYRAGNKYTKQKSRKENIELAHPGKDGMRTLEHSFSLPGADNTYQHISLVHEPMSVSLEEFASFANGVIPEEVLHEAIESILMALDLPHTEAGLIHTDLQAKNILYRIKDPGIFKHYEEAEMTHPVPRIINGDRIIYLTRRPRMSIALPMVIADWGERAPEVFLETPWNEKVDIWNLGVLIWNIFENRSLFHALDEQGDLCNGHHLAEMVALLGSPPPELVKNNVYGSKYFNEDEHPKWINIQDTSFEKLETRLTGANKERFLAFIRSMLKWDPAKRASAKELLQDERIDRVWD